MPDDRPFRPEPCEMFARERAAEALPFTGERLTSAIAGQIEIEHFHRYFLARSLCAGRDVLDVACGEGYGSAFLSQVAKSVVGIDVDTATIAHAAASFRRDNLRFAVGDARRLPLPAEAIDVVVSFETIEHFAEHESFFAEIRRVLRPGGSLIISSPDKEIYSAPDSAFNPFHVKELTRADFIRLLRRSFAHVACASQRPMIGSAILPAEPDAPASSLVFERRGEQEFEAWTTMPRAVYAVAIASDRPVSLPASLYIEHSDIDGPTRNMEHAIARMNDALARADEEARSAHAALRREREQQVQRELAECARRDAEARATSAHQQATSAHQQVQAAAEALQRSVAECVSLELQLRAVERSTTWRATWPLRRFASRHPDAARQVSRAAKLGWWSVTGQLRQRFGQWQQARAARRSLPMMAPSILDPAVEITLPRHDQPVVSVIMPTYGTVDYVRRCLGSISQHCPKTPFEVIVAEDASGDPAIVGLSEIENLRLLMNATNLGFLRSCNQVAQSARGEFLLLLNNDTQVTPGWLDRLVDVLRAKPDAGAVGSKLIYPDGRLQEAGGIIWNDGTGWNFGRFESPDLPVFNYLREVDYCSGASLMVRRTLWEELGGFDEHYAPAYCEDADLAFRIRAAGKKVFYQPRSVVIHFEGISHGTDLESGGKAHQVENQRKLALRWREQLAREHFPSGTHIMRARDRAARRRVALIIDHFVPQPDRDAGSRTITAYVTALQAADFVVKFWPQNLAQNPGYTERLEDQGVEVVYGASSPTFDEWIRENGADLDLVLLSRPNVSVDYLAQLKHNTNARLLYYGHDLHCLRLRRQAELTGSAADFAAADEVERLERLAWRSTDIVLYPSDEEAAVVRAMEPAANARAVVPYCFTRFGASRQAVPGREILFVAGFAHPPNEDAAVWFVEHVLPAVRSSVPDATLSMVGSNPTARVSALAGGPITLAANVSDDELAARYARARVAVVPLRIGAGVKLKVVEALAEGVPLVTTQVGAQGCPGLAELVAVRDDAAGFADAVCRLLTDDAAWEQACRAQIAYAQQRFSEEALRRSLLTSCGFE